MTRGSLRSLLLALALTTAGWAGQQPTPSTSTAFSDLFRAAASALGARQYAEVIASSNEVLASAGRTPDDVYAAHYFQMQAFQAQRDTNGVIAALEGMLGSGFATTPGMQNNLRKPLASAYFHQRNYAQALRHGNAILASGADDDEVRAIVAQSHYLSGNLGEAIKAFTTLVEVAEMAGRKPDRNALIALRAACRQADDAGCVRATQEKLDRHYPALRPMPDPQAPAPWIDLRRELRDSA